MWPTVLVGTIHFERITLQGPFQSGVAGIVKLPWSYTDRFSCLLAARWTGLTPCELPSTLSKLIALAEQT